MSNSATQPRRPWGWILSAFLGGLLVGNLAGRDWLGGGPADGLPRAAGAQEPAASPTSSPPDPWLAGSAEEKFAQIEKQLRGLDQAMAEIGYRYGELLIAARTDNWDYAKYQAEKIDLSLRLAIQRRPKRAKSSQPFLDNSLPPVLAAIAAKDGRQLDAALDQLHAGCVQCHRDENVLHFKEAADRIRARSQSE